MKWSRCAEKHGKRQPLSGSNTETKARKPWLCGLCELNEVLFHLTEFSVVLFYLLGHVKIGGHLMYIISISSSVLAGKWGRAGRRERDRQIDR
jgi:hypothetical protein